MEKLYHKGVMKTKVDDCQFVCIAQTDYYKILHQVRTSPPSKALLHSLPPPLTVNSIPKALQVSDTMIHLPLLDFLKILNLSTNRFQEFTKFTVKSQSQRFQWGC